MASFYHSDQSDLCNGGGEFGSDYGSSSHMAFHTVNWTQQPQMLQLAPLPPVSYPVNGTYSAKMNDDQIQTAPFYGYCPSTTPLSSSPTTPTSPVSSVKMEPGASDGHQSNGTEATLSDDQLVRMSVRDLNYLLQGSDRRVITAYKQKRRTLKNRGYALSCRVRRIQMQQQLEEENNLLKRELAELKVLLAQTQHQLRYYQHGQQNMHIQHVPQTMEPPQPHPRLQTQYSEESPISGSSSWSSGSDRSPIGSFDTLRDLF